MGIGNLPRHCWRRASHKGCERSAQKEEQDRAEHVEQEGGRLLSAVRAGFCPNRGRGRRDAGANVCPGMISTSPVGERDDALAWQRRSPNPVRALEL